MLYMGDGANNTFCYLAKTEKLVAMTKLKPNILLINGDTELQPISMIVI